MLHIPRYWSQNGFEYLKSQSAELSFTTDLAHSMISPFIWCRPLQLREFSEWKAQSAAVIINISDTQFPLSRE